MVSISTNLAGNMASNAWDFINSPMGTYVLYILGIVVIFAFIEIVTGNRE
jgi:hypothetical protein